jgi:hypothetical protein
MDRVDVSVTSQFMSLFSQDLMTIANIDHEEGSTSINSITDNLIKVTCLVGSVQLEALIDSGATLSYMSIDALDKLQQVGQNLMIELFNHPVVIGDKSEVSDELLLDCRSTHSMLTFQ